MAKHSNDKILTVANVITIVRIILIPVFIVLLFNKQNVPAFIVFVIACISDGVDGFVARHFNQGSKLGVVLDPIADRGLILAGSIVLCMLDRLPMWIVVLVFLRDITFLCGGLYLMKTINWRPKVIILGKVATTFFYIGFAMLVLAWPWGFGPGIVDISWLPGLGGDIFLWGIWPVYIGIILNIYTSTFYIKEAITRYNKSKKVKKVKNAKH